jgi:hypothetical protein
LQGDFYSSVGDGIIIERIALEPFQASTIELGELGEWADDKPET